MPEILRSALLPFPADSIYQIVNDVASYPQFLPWCGGVEIHRQEAQSMEASILMRKGKLNHSFTTRNTMLPGQSIEMALVEGPFTVLEGKWQFIAITEQACKIEFFLKFEVSSRVASAIITPAFTHIANSMVDSFSARAVDLYG